jgi:diphthine synthase
MTLTLIGLGLKDHDDLSLRALKYARQMDSLYLESYTMKLDTNLEELSRVIGNPVIHLFRGDMEEDSFNLIEQSKLGNVGILVGGDALSATTHISLLVEAKKTGVPINVIHGSSVFSAVAEAGLSLYKFGKTVTIPFPEKGPVDTVLRAFKENRQYGLHTLLLLDLNIPEKKYLTIDTAIRLLGETENFDMSELLIGIARLGYDNSVIKADRAKKLLDFDFGDPPHVLILPGKLHFYEEEALRLLAGCPPEVLKDRVITGELDRLIEQYSSGCRRVLQELNPRKLPKTINNVEIIGMLDHAKRYLDDAEYYRKEQKEVSLVSVSYAEGVLDALKLLGLVEFEW